MASRLRAPRVTGLWLATLLAAPAFAEEPVAPPPVTADSVVPADPALDAPFSALPASSETPFDPGQPVFDPNFDPGFDPNFGTGFDPATAAATTAADTPDYPPPNIDAYVDIAGGSPDFDNLGYSDTDNGYRIVVGFLLEDVGGEKWRVAPEVGFLRLGNAQREESRVDLVYDTSYETTITDTYTEEVSSLTFGARLGWRLGAHAEPFVRAGAHLYHTLHREQTTYEFKPKDGITTERPTEVTQPQSTSEAKFAPYGTVGFAWSLGPVPSIYVEQGFYFVDSEPVTLTAVGFLLNF